MHDCSSDLNSSSEGCLVGDRGQCCKVLREDHAAASHFYMAYLEPEQRANAILLDLGRLDVWAIQTSSLPKSENVWASLTQLAEPMSSLGSRTVSQIFW